MVANTITQILRGDLQATIPDTLGALLKADTLALQRLWDDCYGSATHIVTPPTSEAKLFELLLTFYIYQRSPEFDPAVGRQLDIGRFDVAMQDRGILVVKITDRIHNLLGPIVDYFHFQMAPLNSAIINQFLQILARNVIHDQVIASPFRKEVRYFG